MFWKKIIIMGIFHSTNLDENLEEIVETEDCEILQMKEPNGGGCRNINIHLKNALFMALLLRGGEKKSPDFTFLQLFLIEQLLRIH